MCVPVCKRVCMSLPICVSVSLWFRMFVSVYICISVWMSVFKCIFSRWNEVMRKIEMWVEFHELNDQGEYTPVEVLPKPEVPCAGVFQLRQVRNRGQVAYCVHLLIHISNKWIC